MPGKIHRTLKKLAAAAHALRGERARILCYHSISGQRQDRWSNSPAQLDAHLRLLREEGWTILPLSELVERLRRGRGYARIAALTFDDGYRDFLHEALPILSAHAAPAALFVPAGLLGGASQWYSPVPDAPLLSPQELGQVARAGVEVGSHGLAHLRLPELNEAGLAAEVAGSRRVLEEIIGRPPLAFSYPFGEFGGREVEAVRRAGYACALSFGGLFGNGPEIDVYRLKRDRLNRPDGEAELRDVLRGWRDWRRAIRKTVEGRQ